jgi:hypothetical protein
MLQTSLFNKTTRLLAVTILPFLFTMHLCAQQVTINPSSLFFSTTQNHASIVQQFSITVSGVAASTRTFIKIPALYEVPGQIGSTGGTVILSGNATVIIGLRFAANATPGVYNANVDITAPDFKIEQTIKLTADNLQAPVPIVNPAKLTGFSAVQGGSISPAQSFSLSISGMPTQGDTLVTVKASQGYSISLSGIAGTFVQSFILFAKNGAINSKVFVIIKSTNDTGVVTGKVSITGTHIKTKNVSLSGVVTAKPQPTLTVSKSQLSFATTTFKVSAIQSYQLTASNLSTGISASVQAPAGYEISLTNTGTFVGQLTIAQNTGSINSTIFVRLKAQSTTGTITGIITNKVAGLTDSVNVSGTVSLPPSLTVNPTSLSNFSTVTNQPSAIKKYTLVANNLASGDRASITAPANYEVRQEGKAAFASFVTIAQTSIGTINTVIEVRIKAGVTTGTVSGFIQNAIAGISKTVGVSGFK